MKSSIPPCYQFSEFLKLTLSKAWVTNYDELKWRAERRVESGHVSFIRVVPRGGGVSGSHFLQEKTKGSICTPFKMFVQETILF